jgi:RHS repeat-associated protein
MKIPLPSGNFIYIGKQNQEIQLTKKSADLVRDEQGNVNGTIPSYSLENVEKYVNVVFSPNSYIKNFVFLFENIAEIQFPINYLTSRIKNGNFVVKRWDDDIYAIEDASGRQEFSYGTMGEVIGNIRTFALPNESNTYTFAMGFEYDSWNRILSTTYPDGEQVRYWYNKGAQLRKMASNYNNVTYNYIDSISYNEFEKRTKICYGNGTYATYTYDTLQRLSNLSSVCYNGSMQNINYNYDNLNNITYIDNGATTLNNGMGNIYWFRLFYDNQNRLDSASGRWGGLYNQKYNISNSYYDDGRIKTKYVWSQNLINGNSSTTNYYNRYTYNSSQPHTIEATDDYNSTESQRFSWDPNGNMTYFDNNNTMIDRHLCWDEENRLVAVSDKNYISHYIYDHSGERTYKLVGRSSAMNINGELKDYTNFDDPTLYTGGYLVATKKGYTKHYYAGSERILSSIGQGGLNMIDQPLHVARYHDWAEKSHSLYVQLNQIMENCLDAVFTNEKGRLTELYNYKNRVSTDPVSYYYYHPDHLGSSSWITDRNGVAIQHFMYLPFGEDWIQQKTTSWSSPYTFSGKEKDAETGYGYFGARYYDSGLSIWLSVDPMSDERLWLTPYNYCQNNPIILIDPDGNKDEPFDASKHQQFKEVGHHGRLIKYTTRNGKNGYSFLSQLLVYNCHSYAWHHTLGDWKPAPNDIPKQADNSTLPRWDNNPADDIMKNNVTQLSNTEANKRGDIVIYYIDSNKDGVYNDGEVIVHSAKVKKVDKNGNTVIIKGKNGQGGIFKGHPDAPNNPYLTYKGQKTKRAYFRKSIF